MIKFNLPNIAKNVAEAYMGLAEELDLNLKNEKDYNYLKNAIHQIGFDDVIEQEMLRYIKHVMIGE